MTAKWICSTMQIAPHVNWNKMNDSYMCQDISRQVSPLQQNKSSHPFGVSSTMRKRARHRTLTGFCMEVTLWPRLKKAEKVSSSQGSTITGNQRTTPLWEVPETFDGAVCCHWWTTLLAMPIFYDRVLCLFVFLTFKNIKIEMETLSRITMGFVSFFSFFIVFILLRESKNQEHVQI